MLTSAAGTLKLGLYVEAQKGLSASMKLSLPGTRSHSNLSFRSFQDQREKNFKNAGSRPSRPIWKISVFRTETKRGLDSAHHTCNIVKIKWRARRTVRSQIWDWHKPTQSYPLPMNNIKTERNKKAERGTAFARFDSTYTEIGTLDRSLKMPQW